MRVIAEQVSRGRRAQDGEAPADGWDSEDSLESRREGMNRNRVQDNRGPLKAIALTLVQIQGGKKTIHILKILWKYSVKSVKLYDKECVIFLIELRLNTELGWMYAGNSFDF